MVKKALLSPYTKTFYIEWKLDPERDDYNLAIDQKLEGPLDISRLGRAVERFIREYFVVNSHIEGKDDHLYWVGNQSTTGLEIIDGMIDNGDIVLEKVRKPFNLETGPLYRFILFKYKNDKFRLVLVFHHVIIDALSLDTIILELSHYYNDFSYKNPITIDSQIEKISDLSSQFLRSIKTYKEKSIEFWKERLSGIEPLELNFIKSSCIQKNENEEQKLKLNSVREITFSFEENIIEKLKILSLTPHLIGQIVFSILIYRYTGQEKFCISYPIAIKKGGDFIYGAHVNTIIFPYDFLLISNISDAVSYAKNFIRSLYNKDLKHSYLPVADIATISNLITSVLKFALRATLIYQVILCLSCRQ